jgi:hypothetical protein
MVVGVSKKDIRGAKNSMAWAIGEAQPDDKIVALHVPKLTPEVMLSGVSMTDPCDATEHAFAALGGDEAAAGDPAHSQIKEVADAEMKRLGKDLNIAYKIAPAALDVKTDFLVACKAESAGLLVLGPGITGKGELSSCTIKSAENFSMRVVRVE